MCNTKIFRSDYPAGIPECGTDQPGTSGDTEDTGDKEGSARERKLEQIRDICAEKLPAAAAAPTSIPAAASASAASPHKFLEPGSSSEDEQAAAAARRDNRLKRGRHKETAEASKQEIEEMFRCVSRQSRPSSQVTRLKFYPNIYFSYIL